MPKKRNKRNRSKSSAKRTAGECLDCGKSQRVEYNEWFHASPPRCSGCGGRLEKIKAHPETIRKMSAPRKSNAKIGDD